MDYRMIATLAAASFLYALPASAVTVTNSSADALKLGIGVHGSPMQTKEIAAGKSVSFDCKSGCGLSGPWQGVEWAKGDQKFKTDGKTIDSM